MLMSDKMDCCDRRKTVEKELVAAANGSTHCWRARNHKMEVYNNTGSKINRILFMIVTFLLVLTSTAARAVETGDTCNWIGSGLDTDASEHSIHQVTLNCQSGHVSWSYPRNALHLTFSLPTTTQTKGKLRLCLDIKVSGNGANIYRDAPGKLVPVLLDDRPEYERNTLGNEQHVHDIYDRLLIERTSPKEEHCFTSEDGKASLYIEAASNPRSLKYVTTLDYRLELLPEHRHPFHHVKKECRRCEGGEIVAAFCSSDFAVKARMLALTEEETTRETYIDLAIGNVYRQRDAIFLPGKHSRYYGLVATPTQCGVKKLEGQYLITGQIILGRAELGCVAHMSVAKKVAKEVSEANISPCDLSPLLGHHHRYIE